MKRQGTGCQGFGGNHSPGVCKDAQCFNCALTIPVPNADPVGVQTCLDAIFKGLVPISLTLFCTWLLQKKVNVVWLILGIMALGLIFGMTGIVAVG